MKSREDLIKETIELERLAMRYKKGLSDILKHLEAVGGEMYKHTGTYAIVTKVLEDK